MPADRETTLYIGRRGLNLRDDVSTLRDQELADTMNWQIGRRGSLEKRLGFIPFGTVAAPAPILEQAAFRPSTGTTYLVVYCSDGQVYRTVDGVTWTSIATGLSTSARPTFVQYLDRLYWANGVDQLRWWDGTTVNAVASAPLGEFLALWRNRLWIASRAGRTVYWSKYGDPTDWTNQPYNRQAFPDYPLIEAITTAPNVGAGSDGSDGVLVATSASVHRIVDDSDNSSGVVVGGANVLVDGGQGFLSQRGIAHDRGRVYGIGLDGVYSTDGRSQLKNESVLLGPAFHDLLNYNAVEEWCAFALHGRYYLAATPTTDGFNSRLFELYLDLPQNEENQHPWMVHNVPLRAVVVLVDPVTGDDRILFADASAGDTARVRRLFQGGSDADGANTQVNISALARSGANDFGIEFVKYVRKLVLVGSGTITISISADGEAGAGESKTFTIESASDTWSPTDTWNSGVWGPLGGSRSKPQFYTKRGRGLAFEVSESSQLVTSSRRSLGLGSVVAGGAAVDALHLTLTPLDC